MLESLQKQHMEPSSESGLVPVRVHCSWSRCIRFMCVTLMALSLLFLMCTLFGWGVYYGICGDPDDDCALAPHRLGFALLFGFCILFVAFLCIFGCALCCGWFKFRHK